MDRLCDDFGLDTIEMGCTLGVLMEGGAIPWGDGPGGHQDAEEGRRATTPGG